MARTVKQIAIAKYNKRVEFEAKYCTDEILALEQRYKELNTLIDAEKRFSPEYKKLLNEQNGICGTLGHCWMDSYLKQNPDKTQHDYLELERSWTLLNQEGEAIGVTNSIVL